VRGMFGLYPVRWAHACGVRQPFRMRPKPFVPDVRASMPSNAKSVVRGRWLEIGNARLEVDVAALPASLKHLAPPDSE
jgi:hypothetical protein